MLSLKLVLKLNNAEPKTACYIAFESKNTETLMFQV